MHPSKAKRKSFCWGSIDSLQSTFLKLNLELYSLFSHPFTNQSHGISWKLEPSGIFSVASLRKYIDGNSLPKSEFWWDWNHLVPRKLNILAWRVIHGRRPTLDNLCKLGIGSSHLCTLCKQAPESASHLFTTCSISREVWSNIRTWWYLFPNSFDSVEEMLNYRHGSSQKNDPNSIQGAIVLVFMWVIWKFRNTIAHSSKILSHSGLASEIQILSHLWISSRHKSLKLNWLGWSCNPVLEANQRGSGVGQGG